MIYEERLGSAALVVATVAAKAFKFIVDKRADFKARRAAAQGQREIEELTRQIEALDREIMSYGVRRDEIDSLTDEKIAEYAAKKEKYDREKRNLILGSAAALAAGLLIAR